MSTKPPSLADLQAADSWAPIVPLPIVHANGIRTLGGNLPLAAPGRLLRSFTTQAQNNNVLVMASITGYQVTAVGSNDIFWQVTDVGGITIIISAIVTYYFNALSDHRTFPTCFMSGPLPAGDYELRAWQTNPNGRFAVQDIASFSIIEFPTNG